MGIRDDITQNDVEKVLKSTESILGALHPLLSKCELQTPDAFGRRKKLHEDTQEDKDRDEIIDGAHTAIHKLRKYMKNLDTRFQPQNKKEK